MNLFKEWKEGREYRNFIEEYRPKEFHPMLFGIYVDYPSYLYIKDHSINEILGEIELYDELDTDIMRIDVRYDHWLKNDIENINKLERAIEEVKKRNKKLWLSVYGVEEWSGVRLEDYGLASWEEWKKMYKKQINLITTNYNPDYLMIMPEAPSLMQNQIKEEIKTEEWVVFTEEMASLIKEISPNTKIIIVTALQIDDPRISNRDYFKQLMQRDNDIDIMGVDPYSLYELEYYTNEYALPYRNPTKELWITETWDNWKIEYRKVYSKMHVKAGIYYAQNKDMTGFVLFPGGWGLHNEEFNKNDAFDAYKEIIKEVRRYTK